MNRHDSMSISNLLNPERKARTMTTIKEHCDASVLSSFSSSFSPTSVEASKKGKDMPAYRKQQPVLKVNYPSYTVDEHSTAHEVQLSHSLFPMNDIDEYAAHIPYSSSKTQFQEQTGRTAVEVFMYEFRIPSDPSKGGKRYVIYWDYNYGLVRMTNMYKACGLAKIIPRKALAANDGLLDISHSLTGGNLEAQGYWVPFEAAKALAARFAYDIRYLLVPIFGQDFPDICVPPKHADFRNYKIDSAIVERCKADTKQWITQGNALCSHAETPAYSRNGNRAGKRKREASTESDSSTSSRSTALASSLSGSDVSSATSFNQATHRGVTSRRDSFASTAKIRAVSTAKAANKAKDTTYGPAEVQAAEALLTLWQYLSCNSTDGQAPLARCARLAASFSKDQLRQQSPVTNKTSDGYGRGDQSSSAFQRPLQKKARL